MNTRVNTQAADHHFSVAVLKNQKQLLADALRNRCSQKFCTIQGKTPVLESLFNKFAGLELSCEYCNRFRNSFFHKTPTVVASEKFINFLEKYQWQRRNRLIFLINMTDKTLY